MRSKCDVRLPQTPQLKGHTRPPCRCTRNPGTEFLIRWPYLKAWLVHPSFSYPANNYQSYQKLDSLQEQWTSQNFLRFLTSVNSQTRKRKAVLLRLFLFWPGTQGYLKVEETLEVGQRPFGARQASQISALWLRKRAFCLLSLESLPSGQGQVFAEARGGMSWNEQHLGCTPGRQPLWSGHFPGCNNSSQAGSQMYLRRKG